MRVEGSEPVEPKRSNDTTTRQTVEAQQLLNRYFRGARLSEMGSAGEETAQALRDFQKQRGLDVTGRPDASTLSELRRAVASLERYAGSESSELEPMAGRTDAKAHGRVGEDLMARKLLAQASAKGASKDVARKANGGATGGKPVASGPGKSFEPREATELESTLIEAAIALRPELQTVQRLAERYDKTIVVGLGVDAGANPVGAFANAGVYFGPDGEMGFTGSAGGGGSVSVTPGASLTGQLTILDGGPEMLEGSFDFAGAGASALYMKAATSVVLDEELDVVGVTIGLGATTDFADVEAFLQRGWGTATQPVKLED